MGCNTVDQRSPQGISCQYDSAARCEEEDKFGLDKMLKERNESCTIKEVATIVAGLKASAVEEVAGHA